jgi:hypothetical protein
MTIKFYCSCGKHLKARDEMAARRSVCPRCGSPVGIPSLKPTHRGTVAAPMTPFERMERARARAEAPGVTAEPEPDSAPPEAPRPVESWRVRLLSERAKRRPEAAGHVLETHWYQCLLYPLRAWRLCFGVAWILTALSAAVAMFVPQFLAEAPSQTWALTVFGVTWGMTLVLMIGFPSSFLECVLSSAAAGEVSYIR